MDWGQQERQGRVGWRRRRTRGVYRGRREEGGIASTTCPVYRNELGGLVPWEVARPQRPRSASFGCRHCRTDRPGCADHLPAARRPRPRERGGRRRVCPLGGRLQRQWHHRCPLRCRFCRAICLPGERFHPRTLSRCLPCPSPSPGKARRITNTCPCRLSWAVLSCAAQASPPTSSPPSSTPGPALSTGLG